MFTATATQTAAIAISRSNRATLAHCGFRTNAKATVHCDDKTDKSLFILPPRSKAPFDATRTNTKWHASNFSKTEFTLIPGS